MSKINCLLLNTNTKIKCIKIDSNTDINNLDIEAIQIGKKGNGDIKRFCDWKLDNYTISIFGWKDGSPGTENKTELPPPEDKDLYFGNILVIKSQNDTLENLTTAEFNLFIEKANGGFEDLGDEDTDTDNDDNEYDLNDSFIDDSPIQANPNYTSESEMSDRITDESDLSD
uniref:Uncharacterized protein n=1 Tax=viral metagenome TaxID=1070528 RepID=A0A6C0IXW8_9ZZZZ